jgi:hypothetical protein
MSPEPLNHFPGIKPTQLLSLMIVVVLLAAPLFAQRPATPAKPPARPPAAPQTATRAPQPTFENLLGADRYKIYGEIRNVGQLMGAGGVGEIVDPIIKLADPPKEFQSIITFLKKHAEALASARLLFAAWPVRTDVPNAFVAIEFSSAEEAAKFAPQLQKFLPTVLPPVPEPTPEINLDSIPNSSPTSSAPAQSKAGGTSQQPAVAEPKKETVAPTPPPVRTATTAPAERLPFVMSHSGNLVFISDKAFKFEKLHPEGTKALFEDQNFRIAHDRFSTEPVFVFFNVALEEKGKAKTQQTIAEAEAEQNRKIEEAKAAATAQAEAEAEAEIARTAQLSSSGTPKLAPDRDEQNERPVAVLTAGPEPSPTPTPTKEQQVQTIASRQMGRMFDALGFGEPQWPEALGLALALDNQDYVIKAILIDPPDAKKLPIPFVPQLISGPSYASDAPSVLPEDTEVFVTASIDLLQTYEGMRKEAEKKARAEPRQIPAGAKELPLDPFAEFEQKAGFKIKDDLLPVLGNEIALAGSLSSLQGASIFGIAPPRSPKAAPDSDEAKSEKEKKGSDVFPMLLIAVKDRDAARRLMPQVLNGLGFGEANLIAQVEKRGDTEMVNYANVFAYAFVGNYLVISEAATVRRVIDAAFNHQTLSSNSAFRNSRRWEPTRTLGQIYVSPALMEAYHGEIRKSGGSTVDVTMRDFLLGLDPTATAITYALSNEGLGSQHEIHLPRNLIITMVAGISYATKNPPPEANEAVAAGALHMIASAQTSYHSTAGKGSYGTLDQLIEQKLLSMDAFEKYGYKFEVKTSGDNFEAVATPKEYGATGKRSFFVDKSGVVRGDDHGGGPATASDKPVN